MYARGYRVDHEFHQIPGSVLGSCLTGLQLLFAVAVVAAAVMALLIVRGVV